jgi:hypothetical protein
MPGGATSCLGARQTLGSSHRLLEIADCQLPIADFKIPLGLIGNRQLEIGNESSH